MELFLEYAFVSLADVIQRSEFALGSSLQLAVVFCLHVSMKKLIFCHMWPILHVHLALMTVHFTHVTPPTPQSISCLIL